MARTSGDLARRYCLTVCALASAGAALAAPATAPRPVDARELPARTVQSHVRMTIWQIAWGGPKGPQRLRVNYTLDDQRLAADARGQWAIDRVSVARLGGQQIQTSPTFDQDRIHLSNIDWRDDKEILVTVRVYNRKAPKHALGLFDEAMTFQHLLLPKGADPAAVGTTLKSARGSTVTVRQIGWWQPQEGRPRLVLVCAASPPVGRPDIDVRLLAGRDGATDDRGKSLEIERLTSGSLLRADDGEPEVGLVTVVCGRAPTTTATELTLSLTLREHLAEREDPEHFRTYSFRVAVPPPQ